MSKKRNIPEQEKPPEPETIYHAVFGLAATIFGVVCYGLAFAEPVGIYGLIAGIVCEIAAPGFFRIQKKKKELPWCKYMLIAAYVLLILGVLFMIGGIIWASTQ